MKNLSMAMALSLSCVFTSAAPLETEKEVSGTMKCEIPVGAAQDYFEYETRYAQSQLNDRQKRVYDEILKSEGNQVFLSADETQGQLSFMSASGETKEFSVRMISRTNCGGETSIGCGQRLLIGIDYRDSNSSKNTLGIYLPTEFSVDTFYVRPASRQDLAKTYRSVYGVNFNGIINNNRFPNFKTPFAKGYYSCTGEFRVKL
jgi:hypothetical protein